MRFNLICLLYSFHVGKKREENIFNIELIHIKIL
jgi:hypothetical protein